MSTPLFLTCTRLTEFRYPKMMPRVMSKEWLQCRKRLVGLIFSPGSYATRCEQKGCRRAAPFGFLGCQNVTASVVAFYPSRCLRERSAAQAFRCFGRLRSEGANACPMDVDQNNVSVWKESLRLTRDPEKQRDICRFLPFTLSVDRIGAPGPAPRSRGRIPLARPSPGCRALRGALESFGYTTNLSAF